MDNSEQETVKCETKEESEFDEFECKLSENVLKKDNLKRKKLKKIPSSEETGSKTIKIESDFADCSDHSLNSCLDDSLNDSLGAENNGSIASDSLILHDILSKKKMELLRCPEVIAFIQEKINENQTKS